MASASLLQVSGNALLVIWPVRPAELARRMHTSKQEVNRITTLRHATKADRIADALAALGKWLTVHLSAA